MIDTDKYEGRTEGKWIADGDDEWGWAVRTPKHDDPYAFIERRNDDGEVVSLSEADARLIADAPLLFAEVKRLREQLTSADKMIREMIRESRDTPREAYVSGSAREAEQLFVHVLEANWDEVIE